MLPASHAAVLRRVSAALSTAGVPHGLGGSGLLALLGLPVTVRDLDIEIDRGHRDVVTGVASLRGFAVEDPSATRGPLIRTGAGDLAGRWMLRGTIDAVPVEIFEHYTLRSQGRECPLTLRLEETARLDGDEIPLADAGFWWALYSVLDPAKARMLADLVPSPVRARAARELGLSG